VCSYMCGVYILEKHWKIGGSLCRALACFPPSSDPARADARGCWSVSKTVGKPQRPCHQQRAPKWLVLKPERRSCARARADVGARSAGKRVADTRDLGDMSPEIRNESGPQSAILRVCCVDSKPRAGREETIEHHTTMLLFSASASAVL
jgi:hypothetical protein